MSSTVKNFSVTYDAINESNTFTSGDYIKGQIILELAKDCNINSLSIKMKGKAEVRWSQKHGKTTHTYYAKDKYFSITQWMIREQKGEGQDQQTLLMGQNGEPFCSVAAPGTHVYPFTFRIPQQDMPSSFKGWHGKIRYGLFAQMSRSMRMDSNAHAEFNFVSTVNMNNMSGLMAPQHGTKDKDVKFFNSGKVTMDIHTDRMGYYQGEAVKVVASVENSSRKEITPKFALREKHIFFAHGRSKLYTNEILKEVGEPIPPSSKQTVTKVIQIPSNLSPSVLNCKILKAEYMLKVYLDIPYSFDPEVKLSLVILPANQAPGQQMWQQPGQQPGQQMWQQPGQQPPPPYSSLGFEPYANPTQPAWNSAPQVPTAPPGAYPPPPAYGAYPSPSDFGSNVMEEKK